MAKAGAVAEKIPARVPIVDYLAVPEKGEPWLLGNRCPRCGKTYLGKRIACSNCSYSGSFEEIKLSKQGKIYVFSVVYQSIPQIRTPYITCIVDLPEGVAVRGTLREMEPDPRLISFDMPVEMFFESAGVDDNGSQVISYYFHPAEKALRKKREPIMRPANERAEKKAAKKAKAKGSTAGSRSTKKTKKKAARTAGRLTKKTAKKSAAKSGKKKAAPKRTKKAASKKPASSKAKSARKKSKEKH